MRISGMVSVVGLVLALVAPQAMAQATRTWVSGVGDDANPCSRTAPCKTFAGAISKTAARGEINIIDAGGFGAVTITKAITIDGGGSFGSILGAGTNGVIVNAGASDVVVLRNLSINGAGTGLSGVRFLAGAALLLENVQVTGFNKGVEAVPSAGTPKVSLKNVQISNAPQGALQVKPTPPAVALLSVESSHFERSLFGVRVEDNTKATIRGSSASINTNNGFLAASGGGGAVELSLDTVVAANNGTNGVVTSGAAATIRIANSTVIDNGVGLNSSGGGAILSFGTNRIAGNGVNGTPTGGLGQI